MHLRKWIEQKVSAQSPASTFLVMTVICAIAFGLRWWGIGYGLPHLYFTDEVTVVNQVLSMGYFKTLKPDHYLYPTGMLYLAAFLYGAFYGMCYLSGSVHSAIDFALSMISDPTPLYLIARSISVVSGAGMSLMVYLIARRLFNSRIGLLGALLTAVNYQLANIAHFVKAQTLEGFCVLLAFYLTVRAVQSPTNRAFALAGMMTGVCASVRYTAGLIIFAELFLIMTMTGTNGRIRYSLILIGMSMVGFFLLMPYALLDIHNFLKIFTTMKYFSAHMAAGDSDWVTNFMEWLKPAPMLLFLAGILFAMLTKQRYWRILLIYPAAHFVFYNISSPWRNMVWQTPIVPFIALAASGFIIWGWDSFRRPVMRAGIFLMAAAAVGQSAYASAVFAYKLSQPDTRTLALEWIEKNIPHGTALVMDHGRYLPGYAPPVRQMDSSIDRNYLNAEKMMGGWQYGGYKQYFELLKKSKREKPQYEVYPVVHDSYCGQTDFWKTQGPSSLHWYQSQGVRYAIFVRDGDYRKMSSQGVCSDAYFQPYLALYNEVKEKGQFLHQFSPELQGKGLGPVIKIYCVDPNGLCDASSALA